MGKTAGRWVTPLVCGGAAVTPGEKAGRSGTSSGLVCESTGAGSVWVAGEEVLFGGSSRGRVTRRHTEMRAPSRQRRRPDTEVGTRGLEPFNGGSLDLDRYMCVWNPLSGDMQLFFFFLSLWGNLAARLWTWWMMDMGGPGPGLAFFCSACSIAQPVSFGGCLMRRSRHSLHGAQNLPV